MRAFPACGDDPQMYRLLTAILPLCAGVAPGATCSAWLSQPVKLFNEAKAAEGTLNRAKSEAAWLLRSVCVDLNWVPCVPITDPLQMPCSGPAGAMELHILTNTESGDVARSSLGLAFPSSGSRRAGVFFHRVRELVYANEGIIEVGGLLGHVIAHEIGHLLLRSSAHADEGIMRAEFRRQDLKKAAQRQLTFRAEEVKAVRQLVLARR